MCDCFCIKTDYKLRCKRCLKKLFIIIDFSVLLTVGMKMKWASEMRRIYVYMESRSWGILCKLPQPLKNNFNTDERQEVELHKPQQILWMCDCFCIKTDYKLRCKRCLKKLFIIIDFSVLLTVGMKMKWASEMRRIYVYMESRSWGILCKLPQPLKNNFNTDERPEVELHRPQQILWMCDCFFIETDYKLR